jgi:hypothetical protein
MVDVVGAAAASRSPSAGAARGAAIRKLRRNMTMLPGDRRGRQKDYGLPDDDPDSHA